MIRAGSTILMLVFCSLVLLGAWSLVAAMSNDTSCFASVVHGSQCVFPSGTIEAILFHTDALDILTLALATLSFLVVGAVLSRIKPGRLAGLKQFFKSLPRIGRECVYHIYKRIQHISYWNLLEWKNFHINSPSGIN